MDHASLSSPGELERLLNRFGNAWQARAIDRAVACFHSDGVYFASIGPTPGEKATGHAAIRDLIERMFAHDADTTQSIGTPIIAGNAAFQTWLYRDANGDETLGCDLFRFKDGLIVLKDAYRKIHREPHTQDSTP